MARERCCDPQSAAEWMRDRQQRACKCTRFAPGTPARCAAALPYFRVAEDRCADRGAMSAQLMRPAGDRQQGEPARLRADALDRVEIGDRALSFLGIGADPFTLPPRGVWQAPNRCVPAAASARGRRSPNRFYASSLCGTSGSRTPPRRAGDDVKPLPFSSRSPPYFGGPTHASLCLIRSISWCGSNLLKLAGIANKPAGGGPSWTFSRSIVALSSL